MYPLPWKKKTEQKLPSFSNRVKMIGGRVWECMNECSLSFRHLPLSLCSTRGVPTGDVWWASYSIRGALLGRPHQCWVDDVVITLVCIPLPHHCVVDCFMQERMDEIEGESLKEEGEGERHRVKWRSIRNAWLVSNEPPNHLGPWPHSAAQIDGVGRQQSATTLSDCNIPVFSYPKFIRLRGTSNHCC